MTRRPSLLLLLPLSIAFALACENGEEIAVGTLERDRIELVAEANEPIAEILVREGDPVAAGDLIARLAPERLRAQREAASERATGAEARLAEAERPARGADGAGAAGASDAARRCARCSSPRASRAGALGRGCRPARASARSRAPGRRARAARASCSPARAPEIAGARATHGGARQRARRAGDSG
jgi:HlyD family secretion protein